jgi:hypothetical protein
MTFKEWEKAKVRQPLLPCCVSAVRASAVLAASSLMVASSAIAANRSGASDDPTSNINPEGSYEKSRRPFRNHSVWPTASSVGFVVRSRSYRGEDSKGKRFRWSERPRFADSKAVAR